VGAWYKISRTKTVVMTDILSASEKNEIILGWGSALDPTAGAHDAPPDP